ncbi:flagellar protein FlaG [Pelosinus sp. sgz500959]|uniref:flagellar protein FlaG n=1 Tax=Pelosinus sp. sgz500959 TaxID=3242472 RepID=UPI00366E73B1
MSITSVNSGVAPTTVAAVKNDSNTNNVKEVTNKQINETTVNQKQPSEDELKNVTDELNNFMQAMNTDIKFVLHSKTSTLMIQVEDSKTHKVLKECPAHEVLDMVAKLRDYIGAFLDKKA